MLTFQASTSSTAMRSTISPFGQPKETVLVRSLRSELFLHALCFAVSMRARGAYTSADVLLLFVGDKGLAREKASVSSGSEIAKVFLLLTLQQQQQHQRARGQPLPKHIDLFPSRASSFAPPRPATFDCPLL